MTNMTAVQMKKITIMVWAILGRIFIPSQKAVLKR